MHYQIRSYQAPDDDAPLAALSAAASNDPWSETDIVRWRTTFPADGTEYDAVAVDDRQTVVGHGQTHHVPWMAPGEFRVSVLVHPGARRRQLGSVLFAEVAAFAAACGATFLTGIVPADEPAGLGFATSQRFTVVRQEFVSQLNLAEFDGGPFAELRSTLEAQGYRFFTFQENQQAEALYEVARTNYGDIPGADPNAGYPSFSEWRKRWLDDPESPQDCIIIAARGERLVGVTRLGWLNEEHDMKTWHTSVRREVRGRQIGLALKLLAIRAAQRYGARFLFTNNDSRNTAMLRVNERLGFQPTPGVYYVQRDSALADSAPEGPRHESASRGVK